MKVLDIVTLALLIVGGLNWGLWGALEFDLVAAIAGGSTTALAKLVYIVVGLAAAYQVSALVRMTRPQARLATA